MVRNPAELREWIGRTDPGALTSAGPTMHFGLTEERTLLQETLRNFTALELPPNRLRELFDAGAGFDAELWRRAGEVGLLGLIVPETYGGAGLEMLDLALAFEVLGDAAAPGPFLGHALATVAILRGGSEAQRAHWLPRLASGETVGALAVGESVDRWEPRAWSLTALDRRATGSKRFAEASTETGLLVVGLLDGGLALVETDAEGVTLEPLDRLDRTRPLCDIQFDDVPVDRLPCGPEVAEEVMDAGRILLAADAFGAAWKLIRTTVDYVRARKQFGTPIAQFQAVKHELADMAMEAEPMRGLIWYAAYAFDHRPEERAREAATAKAHVTDRAVQIGRGAVALHGGIGFTWECDVQFWVKRTMHDRVWLGSPEAHRERIAQLADW